MLAILHLLVMFVADLFKSRRRLEAENLFLRHQLNIALRRTPPRPRLPGSDRALLVWMTRIWPALIADGSGLVALSYRGYGGSRGRPTETGLVEDAAAAYAFGVAQYPAQRVVLWGESLGSGLALVTAAEKPVGGVVLEAPFTSAADVGAQHYWFVPA